jgi:TolB-like protein
MQKYIAVASFDSPSNDPDSGKQFSDSLISYLYQVLPYGINILERDKIDFVLKERGSEAKSIGELLGVDLIITGTVSLYTVDRVVDERVATVRVKIGEETVLNPEFEQMLNFYGPDMSRWPQKMAQIHGEDSSQWPRIPPRTVRRDQHQLMKYTKGTAQVKGFAKVSIRIFDTAKGTITFVKDFDATVVRTSEFQDEVQEANIPYIPMNLPTDTEIKEEMRKSIVTEVGKIVRSSFENREHRFLNQANFHLDRLEFDAAFEPLAEGYLYCLRDAIAPENEACVKMRGLIDMLVAREDLVPKPPVPTYWGPTGESRPAESTLSFD